jgi:hypothetical protein
MLKKAKMPLAITDRSENKKPAVDSGLFDLTFNIILQKK